jgi:cold-inducible RNA-binding protein
LGDEHEAVHMRRTVLEATALRRIEPPQHAPARAPFDREIRQMGNRLYVGNLAFSTDEQSLQSVFSRFGAVDEVKVVMDRETGRSRGFAFVSMADATGAKSAMTGLDGQLVDGRALRVNEAEERQSNQRGGPRRSW